MIKWLIPKNKKIRMVLLVMVDLFTIYFAYVMALLIRFDFSFMAIETRYISTLTSYFIPYTISAILIFMLFQLYSSMWTVAGIHELYKIVLACIVLELSLFFGMYLMKLQIPRSYYLLNLFFLIAGVGFSRMSYRISRLLYYYFKNIKSSNQARVMIIGAGESASNLIKELKSGEHVNAKIICAIDDNSSKIGKFINGIPIVGARNKIIDSAKKFKINEIYITIPFLDDKEKKQIIEICKETKCKLKILPSFYQLINGELNVSKLRQVEIEDLLGRESVKINLDEVTGYIKDRVIMVTGGGGSIGGELCRQIAKYNPKKLIIFDIYENGAYDVQQELKKSYPNLNLIVLIGSVENEQKLTQIFEKHKPEIIYHAAAHKHVPLMEDSPDEAILNNVFGTLKTAKAADKYGVKKFVLVSSDKAVNPTNIMGATKRICEMIIQTFDKNSNTEFVAVRFGNVLGSNGSVVPLFKKQIEQGGPVTVTHPEIIRYFMTISEATNLILQAGAYAKGGEIFILDMGEPVKILNLAKNLIRLSGYTPDKDIKIEFTGLRPGEKLFEELLMDEEGLKSTDNKLIYIGQPILFNEKHFIDKLENLNKYLYSEKEFLYKFVTSIVPTYIPKSKKNNKKNEEDKILKNVL